MSKKSACETEARRRDYTRWEQKQKRVEAFSAPGEEVSETPLAPTTDDVLTTMEYCERIQRQLLAGMLHAMRKGEPWAYKEAVNVLSRLVPEWKEKSGKKQVPLEEYKKILEKALRP
jgi:hypothetical protein